MCLKWSFAIYGPSHFLLLMSQCYISKVATFFAADELVWEKSAPVHESRNVPTNCFWRRWRNLEDQIQNTFYSYREEETAVQYRYVDCFCVEVRQSLPWQHVVGKLLSYRRLLTIDNCYGQIVEILACFRRDEPQWLCLVECRIMLLVEQWTI